MREKVPMKVSVHVVDSTYAAPAADLKVQLCRQDMDANWVRLARGRTSEYGVLEIWPGGPLDPATYQLQFDLDGYYAALGSMTFYPRAIVEFRVTDSCANLRLPLLISPASYFTYQERQPLDG
jgi:5-hydroxyisourate hydrolase